MLFNVVRRNQAISVKKQKVWRSTGCNSFVPALSQPKAVMLVSCELHGEWAGRNETLDDVVSAVARPIVTHNDFHASVDISLLSDRLQNALQVSRTLKS